MAPSPLLYSGCGYMAKSTYRRNDKLIVLLRSPNLSGARGGMPINGKPSRILLCIFSISFSAANAPKLARSSAATILFSMMIYK